MYLGMALFVSKAEATKGSGAAVGGRVKPLFILVTTVSVIFTRYASVFPLSEMINLYSRRFRPHLPSSMTSSTTASPTSSEDELPHSYQMMIFWAGLRGAVGVALAAGFKGKNAESLRMTVLVVVVLTVLVFGGTTARMLEVLGIRTGVDDPEGDVEDSDDEAGGESKGWRSYGRSRSNSRRPAVRRFSYRDSDHDDRAQSPEGYWNHHNRESTHRQPPGSPIPSSPSEYDSDGAEVLPLAPTASYPFPATSSAGQPPSGPGTPEGGSSRGKWFQTIDEQYLLPIFSNATASRSFHARKSLRNSRSGQNEELFDAETDDGADIGDARTIVLGPVGEARRANGSGSGRATPVLMGRVGSPGVNGGNGNGGDRVPQ